MWPHLDFVSTWKTISIALTGGFGILGLLKDFKDKATNRVTPWGWVSLIGIVVSSVCGIAAQLKESHDDAAKTLALAQKSDKTLTEIERSLSPLDDPTLSIGFDIRCDDAKYLAFCQKLWQKQRKAGKVLVMDDWADFPNPVPQVILPMRVDVFQDAKDAELFLGGKKEVGDWHTNVLSTNYAKDKSLTTYANPDTAEITLAVLNYHASASATVMSNGRIKSIIDIPGTTVMLTDPNNELSRLNLVAFELDIKNGQSIRYIDKFQKVTWCVKDIKDPESKTSGASGEFAIGTTVPTSVAVAPRAGRRAWFQARPKHSAWPTSLWRPQTNGTINLNSFRRSCGSLPRKDVAVAEKLNENQLRL